MKKTLIIMGALLMGTMLGACHHEPDPEAKSCIVGDASLRYASNGVWTSWATSDVIMLNGICFSHDCVMYDEPYVTGFVASKSDDNKYYQGEMWKTPYAYSAIPGKGVRGDHSPYLVAYWPTFESEDTPFDQRAVRVWSEDMSEFTPFTLFVTNTTYDYYAMKDGDGFARKFDKGDWLKIVAHGLRADGSVGVSEFYLADFRNDDPEEWYIVNKWENWNLTQLGKVIGIWFTMESSDSGEWGMNTPSYFALDVLSYFDETDS